MACMMPSKMSATSRLCCSIAPPVRCAVLHHCSSPLAAPASVICMINQGLVCSDNIRFLSCCRCASVCIVREDAVTDGRPPFITYETTVSKKAFENFSQKYIAHSQIGSTRSMSHAASASDLASMNHNSAVQSPCNAKEQVSSEKAVTEEH